MTVLAAPALLWIAGLLCAAIGLRASRSAKGAVVVTVAAPIPALLRLAARIPCPAHVASRLARAGDDADLVRAGLAGTLAPDALARMRAGLAMCGMALSAGLAIATPAAAVTAPLLAAAGVVAPGRWLDAPPGFAAPGALAGAAGPSRPARDLHRVGHGPRSGAAARRRAPRWDARRGGRRGPAGTLPRVPPARGLPRSHRAHRVPGGHAHHRRAAPGRGTGLPLVAARFRGRRRH